MRFFDAHCDTIGPIWESGADFLAEPGTGAAAGDPATAGEPPVLHVTLPGMKAGRIGAQVFASCVWTGQYKGREYEVGMAKVEAVRKLCADHPHDLALAATAADLAAPFADMAGPAGSFAAPADAARAAGGAPAETVPSPAGRIAILPSLEGADPLDGDVDNLFTFYDAGVRLLTLAWADNPFCGSAYGDGLGLTRKGQDLVAACESLGVMVDASHLSDRGFQDLLQVAERPFVASHSNCRALCPSPRNLTDEMIRALGERGGVMGITFAPGFLSKDYYEKERAAEGDSFRAVLSGQKTFEESRAQGIAAMAEVPRPPLSTIVDHVRWAINLGGEDCVGLGGDLDGVSYLPAEFAGVADYPRVEELLRQAGLAARQVEKVCCRNLARVFGEVLG